ncbi:MAG: DUF4180 domain-containing protein [Syntrophomonadaceae bacterium]
METIIHNDKAVEVKLDKKLCSSGDFLELIAGSIYDVYILRQEDFDESFFNLSTGVAGEILQKASNYRIRMAIVGDFSNFASKALADFIYESNRVKQIVFVESVEKALEIFQI